MVWVFATPKVAAQWGRECELCHGICLCWWWKYRFPWPQTDIMGPTYHSARSVVSPTDGFGEQLLFMAVSTGRYNSRNLSHACWLNRSTEKMEYGMPRRWEDFCSEQNREHVYQHIRSFSTRPTLCSRDKNTGYIGVWILIWNMGQSFSLRFLKKDTVATKNSGKDLRMNGGQVWAI